MSYSKLSRDQIAARVAQDIPDGAYVNLGIGLPTKISKYLPSDKDVFLHSENGLLAFGPPPAEGDTSAKNYCISTSGRIALTVTGSFGNGEATEMCLIPQRWYVKLGRQSE